MGTVQVASYFDIHSGLTYAPTAFAAGKSDGSAGLGTESDSIDGNRGVMPFGPGVEAFEGSLLFDFVYTYADGSTYRGTVSDDGGYGYKVGDTIPSAYGSYKILDASPTTQAAGLVFINLYYDTASQASYVPDLFSAGSPSGDNGLGFEVDTITGPAGQLPFGHAGAYEAKQAPNTLYHFSFQYLDGNFYLGTLVDNGSYGYAPGEVIPSPYGAYQIDAGTSPTSQAGGTVAISQYYDTTTNVIYTPSLYAEGLPSGDNGLGFELDYTDGPAGQMQFGKNGALEAYQGRKSTLYDFYYKYNDGSFYYGTVADDGSSGYFAGENVHIGSGGPYHIYGPSGQTADPSGTVHVSSYYDIASRAFYVPANDAIGGSAGEDGLGSETDYISGSAGNQRFGDAGLYEAREAGATLYDFTFTYGDGSYFVGFVSDDGSYGYAVNQTISTAYQGGTFTITGSEGATTYKVGYGLISTYYDALNGEFFKALTQQTYGDYSVRGGVEHSFDEIQDGSDINHPTRYFGFGTAGLYEPNGGFGSTIIPPDNVQPNSTRPVDRAAGAAADGGTTLYDFLFSYSDGSQYSGTVADDGNLGYALQQVITTDHGSYRIVSSAGITSEAPGAVSVSAYYDSSSDTGFTPRSDGGRGQADGSGGLGSEQDSVTGARGCRGLRNGRCRAGYAGDRPVRLHLHLRRWERLRRHGRRRWQPGLCRRPDDYHGAWQATP